jgi:mono/diheme cytochrome c family protein
MRVDDASVSTRTTAPPRRNGRSVLLGIIIGVFGCAFIAAFVLAPAIIAKRGDLPLERIYGDFAVGIASRVGAGNAQNPLANNPRALAAGRDAYTGSCAVCHGAAGDGRGMLGTSSYPNATDLTSHDAVEKSDGQLFWIIKNGLNFTGMPGFADQYSDEDIWSMVSFTRALQNPGSVPQNTGRGPARPAAQGTFAAVDIPAPTTDQLDRANPTSSDPAARGAAVYFAQGCHLCHAATGDAPANLGLSRGGGPEAERAIRQGRPGMPRYPQSQISDQELNDLVAYMATIGSTQRRGD